MKYSVSSVSAESGAFVYSVEYINRSPVIDLADFSLPSITEDISPEDNLGVLVGQLAESVASDSDDTYLGLAVVSLDLSNGAWEYQYSDSIVWVPIPDSNDSILALRNDSRIRFTPNENFFGTSQITAKAWDMSYDVVDFTSRSVSIENVIFTIDVTSVNDQPEIELDETQVIYTENAQPVQIFEDIVITDVDSSSLSVATIVLECPLCSGAVSTSGDGEISSGLSLSPLLNDMIIALHPSPPLFVNEIETSEDMLTSTINIYPDPTGNFSTQPIAAFTQYLETLHFINTDREPSTAPRLITLFVNDGINPSNEARIEVFIQVVNDEVPTVSLASDTFTYIEDSGLVPIFPTNPVIMDLDDNSDFFLEAAEVQLVGRVDLEYENLTVDCTFEPSLTCLYTNGTLLISGSASISIYEEILGDVLYTNNAEEPTANPRGVIITVFDGIHRSVPVQLRIRTILTNDQLPILEPNESTVSFVEANPVSLPIRIAPDLSVFDIDSGFFPVHSVVIELTNPQNSEEEGISVEPGLMLPPYVVVSPDSPYKVLLNFIENARDRVTNMTVTGIPLQVVQNFVRNVRYFNRAVQPEGTSRIVSFTVFDNLTFEGGMAAPPAIVNIEFMFVDDPPMAELNNMVIMYSEGQDERQVLLVPDASIVDVDNMVIFGLEIVLTPSDTDIDVSQEVLVVDLPADGLVNETDNSLNDPLTIILTGVAPLSTYTSILRSLSYEHTEDFGDPDPGNRVVRVTPLDSAGNGVSDEVVIVFNATNNAPILDLNGALPGRNFEATFIEEGVPVYLTSRDFQLIDVDNEELEYVEINLFPTPDSLDEGIFVNMSVSPDLQMTRTDPATIRLYAPAPAPVESFADVLLTLLYANGADEPSPEQRTVRITASDGERQSESITLVNITLVNDPPSLFLNDTQREYTTIFTEEGGPVSLAMSPVVFDPDSLFAELRIVPRVIFDGDEVLSMTEELQYNQEMGYFFIIFSSASSEEVEDVIASISFVNTLSEPVPGDRIVCFSVIDEQQLPSLEPCSVISFSFINDNAPTFDQLTYTAEVDENRRNFPVIQVSANDLDFENTPGTLVYSIVAGDDCHPDVPIFSGSGESPDTFPSLPPCRFTINNITGQVYTTDNPPDRELQDRYILDLSVSDGQFESSAQLTIIIRDVNDVAPTFVPELYDVTVPLGAPANFTLAVITIFDPDIGQVIIFQTSMEPPAGSLQFRFDGETGRVYLAIPENQLDPSISQYVLTFEALDNDFQSSTNVATLIVNVMLNNAEPVFEQSSYSASVRENEVIEGPILTVFATDSDEGSSGEVRYTIEADVPFIVNALSGEIELRTTLDFEDVEEYNFQVIASDLGRPVRSSMTTVRVQVINVNEFQPQFTQMRYTARVCEGTPVGFEILQVSAIDRDAGVLGEVTYSVLAQLDCSGCVSLNASTGVVSVARELDFEERFMSFSLFIQAVDGGFWFSQEADIVVDVLNDNEHPPRFQFDNAQIAIPENYPVGNPLPILTIYNPLALDEDACDVDQCNGAEIVSDTPCSGSAGLVYSIFTSEDNGLFDIDPSTGAITLTRMLDFDIAGDREFLLQLTVSDGEFSSAASLVVEVTDVNDNLPMFDAAQYTVNVTEIVDIGSEIIQISASDIDPTSEISYSLSGPFSEDFLINSTTGVVTVINPLDFETIPVYNLMVIATDEQFDMNGNDTSNTVVVRLDIFLIDVTDELPSLTPPFEFFVLENLPPGPVGQVQAVNPNSMASSQLQFSIVDPTGEFIIDSVSGLISSTVAFDQEEINQYIMAVSVAVVGDGELSLVDSESYSIFIVDVNDNTPTPVQNAYNISLSESVDVGFVVVLVEATDEDSSINGQLVYSISSGNDLGHFAINNITGVIVVTASLDRETNSRYTLVIEVADRGIPSLSAMVTVYVSVTDEPDNPPVFVQTSYSASISENSTNGSPVLEVEAMDIDMGINADINYMFEETAFVNPFIIDPISGLISVAGQIDRELVQEYRLTVTAFNPNFENSMTSMVNVTISISDVNDEVPTFQMEIFQVNVNEDFTPVDTSSEQLVDNIFSGSGDAPQVRQIFTVTAVDLDEPSTVNSQIQFSLLTQSDLFAIDSQTGVITASRDLDRETRNFYRLQVQATDFGTPRLSSTAFVDISILDVNDNSPMFSEVEYNISILEDIQPSSEILRVLVSDFDIGLNSDFVFSLVSSVIVPFEIEATTGQIFTTLSLDRETVPEYSFQVIVSDQGIPALTASTSVVIRLIDTNDNPPVVTPLSVSLLLMENLPPGPLDVTFTVTDEDLGLNSISNISLSGQSSSFAINSFGVLEVSGPLDHETMPELQFSVVVRNVEPPHFTSIAQVDVQLTNVNDNPPVVNFGDNQLVYFERSKELVLSVAAFITDDDGLGVTVLIDGIVELITTDTRDPSFPFTPNTNEFPFSCPLEDDKRTKFSPCRMEADYFFTLIQPDRNVIIVGFNEDDLVDDTIVFDSSQQQYVYSSVSTTFVDSGLTISTWIWVEPPFDNSFPMTIISKSSPSARLYSLYCNSDWSLGFQYTDGEGVQQSISFADGCLQIRNAWHHLAVVLDNTDPSRWSVSVYIDASLFGSQLISPPQDGPGNVYVGARPVGGVNTNRINFFNGRLHLTAFSMTVAKQSNINCVIGCGTALISSIRSTPLEYVYNYTTRALTIRGRQSPQVYEDFLNSLILVLPLIEPVASFYSLSYTVQDEFFNCLPNFVSIVLEPSNDHQPQFTLSGGTSSTPTYIFIEEGGPVSVINQTAFSLTDRDLVAFPYTITVSVLDPQPPNSVEVLEVQNVPFGMNVTSGNYALILAGELPLPMFASVLRTITYNNLDDEPEGISRQLLFTVSDPPFNDVSAISFVDIVPVNDLPVLSVSFGTNEYAEGDGPVQVLQSASITDSDNTTLLSALVLLTALDGSFEVLSVDTSDTNIVPDYDSVTNALGLTGQDTLTNYAQVLQSLTYQHTSDGNTTRGTRRLMFTVSDGVSESQPVEAVIFFSDVNDAPVVDLNGPVGAGSNFETVFIEDGLDYIPAVSQEATLMDVDDNTLENLTFSLSPIPDGILERIRIIIPNDPPRVFQGETITLTMSSITDLQSYLRRLEYVNEAQEPTAGDRIIEVIAHDGVSASIPVFSTIRLETQNDVPVLDINALDPEPGYQTSFTEGEPPVFITSRNVAIVDNDLNAIVDTVMIVINNAPDFLNERIESTHPNVTITPFPSGQSVTYIITPPDTSLSATTQLLTTLVYSNSLEEPTAGTRDISVSVSDGFSFSNVETVLLDVVQVNEHSPQFTQPTYSRSVVEEEPANTTVVVVSAIDLDRGQEGLVSYMIVSSTPPEGIVYFQVDGFGRVSTTRPLDREVIDFYTLNVSAYDGGNPPRVDYATVVIAVLDVNDQTPEFRVGTEFNLTVLESRPTGFVIDTLDATDGDLGSNAVVMYDLVGGESSPFDVLPDGQIIVDGPLDADIADTTYTIIVQVSDNGTEPLTNEAEFTITVLDVNDNPPQFVPLAIFSGAIQENLPPQVSILQVSTIDLDSGLNGDVSFSFEDPSLANHFSIDSNTGVVSSVDQFDREARDVYSFTVLAVDGGIPSRTSNATVIITITDQNDIPPTFSQAQYEAQVIENAVPATFVLQVTAFDGDLDQNAEFSFSIVENTALMPPFSTSPLFSINAQTGVIFVNESADFELQPVVNFTVEARDFGVPSLTGRATVTVYILDQNDNPPEFSQVLYQGSAPENEVGAFVALVFANDADLNENGDVTYSLLNWEDRFIVDVRTGEIRTAVGLDFETNCFYRLLVLARDGGTPRLNATALVDVLVSPVNDIAPSFSPSSYSRSISENLPPGTTVTQVTATDGDETVCSSADLMPSNIPLFSGMGPVLGSGMELMEEEAMLVYSLLSHQDLFTIDNDTGVITTLVTLDRELSVQYLLQVQVTDPGTLVDDTVVTVNVLDQNDNSPMFLQPQYSGFVSENAPVGTSVIQVTASDPDFLDQGRLVYDFEGLVDSFSVNNQTGVISVSGPIDFEIVGTTIRLVAIVRDTASREAAALVDIVVTDVNDLPPSINTLPVAQTFTEGDMRLIIFPEISITDPDSSDQLCSATVSLVTPQNVNNAPQGTDCSCVNSSDITTCTVGCMEFIQLQSQLFPGNIAQTSNGAVLTLEGNFSISEYSSAIVQVEYINLISNPLPSSRSISLTVFDCQLPSNTLTQTIEVLALNVFPPVVDLNGPNEPGINYIATFEERGGPIFISSRDAIITDEDMVNEVEELTGLDIWISNPQDGSSESLMYPSQFTHPTVTAVRNSPHSISFRGVATLSDYVDILLQVSFSDVENEPNAMARVINVVARENHLSSEAAVTTITFVTFNDHPPVILTSPPYENSVTSFREGVSGIPITQSNAFISDRDSITDPINELQVYVVSSLLYDRVFLQNSISLPATITIDEISNSALTFRGLANSSEYDIVLRALSYQFTGDEFQSLFPPKFIYIQVSDALYSSFSAVQVQLEPVNDQMPVFLEASYEVVVPENATIGYSIVQVMAVDNDRFSEPNIRYSILAGNDDRFFRISSSDGTIYLNRSLDFEMTPLHRLVVEVMDLNFEGSSSLPAITAVVTIMISDVNDHVPMLSMTEYNVTIAEGVAIGTFLLQVMATDRDSEVHSELEFELFGAEDFQVDRQTGVVSTAAVIDRLVNDRYNFFVTVRNPGILAFDVATITVNVLDLDNNPPVLVLDPTFAVLQEPDTSIPLSTQLQISDLDLSPSLDYALVEVTMENDTFVPGQLISTVYVDGITVTGNNTQRLEFIGESRSLSDYVAVLRGVVYQDLAVEPEDVDRIVQFQVGSNPPSNETLDFQLSPNEMTSEIEEFLVSVSLLNDNPPQLLLDSRGQGIVSPIHSPCRDVQGSFSALYVEDSDPVTLSHSTLTLIDNDSGENLIALVFVEIVNPQDIGSERLIVDLSFGITLSADSSEVRLNLVGPATHAQFETVLRTVR